MTSHNPTYVRVYRSHDSKPESIGGRRAPVLLYLRFLIIVGIFDRHHPSMVVYLGFSGSRTSIVFLRASMIEFLRQFPSEIQVLPPSYGTVSLYHHNLQIEPNVVISVHSIANDHGTVCVNGYRKPTRRQRSQSVSEHTGTTETSSSIMDQQDTCTTTNDRRTLQLHLK